MQNLRKVMKLSLAVVFGLICCQTSLFGQADKLAENECYFEQPNTHLGLSQRAVNDVLQDNEGYVWLASWSGLIRFDGYQTKTFSSDNVAPDQLKSNKITKLLQQNDTTIWVGTSMRGVFRYNTRTGKFEQFVYDATDEHSLSNNNVWALANDQSGNLWVGTKNGLNRLDLDQMKFHRYVHEPSNPNSLSNSFIRDLHIDSQNRLWASTEYGVNALNLNESRLSEFERYAYEDEKDPALRQLHNYTYDILSVDLKGETQVYWVTKKGLKTLENGKVKSFELSSKESEASFFRTFLLVETKHPFFLIGSENGLYAFDIEKDQFIDNIDTPSRFLNLSHSTITTLFLDRSGVLWVGTKKGINTYDCFDNGFKLYLNEDIIAENSIITSISGSGQGRVWLSTMGNGLYQFENTDDQGQSPQQSIAKYQLEIKEEVDFSDFIQKMIVDKQGRVWLGTAGGGVYTFLERDADSRTKRIRNYWHFMQGQENGISDAYVMSMGAARNGGMWIGTWSNGLNYISDQGKVIIYDRPELTQAPIVAIYEDANGVLWLGTRGHGLIRVEVDQVAILNIRFFRFSPDENSISGDFITTIKEDKNGKLWIGTENGLNRLDTSTNEFYVLNKNNGLVQNEVIGLEEDVNGYFWITHNSGINVIDPTRFDRSCLINNFDSRDRVQGGFFFNEVTYQNADGQLYFGGSNGVNIINPKSMVKNLFKPTPIITNFYVFNNTIQANDETGILSWPINLTRSIELKAEQNSISFEFASNHHANPQQNVYSYKLEGFDEDWTVTDANKRFANYTNLKDGRYQFLLRTSNDDGVWSEEEKHVDILIHPPWWKTPWAFVMYLLIVVLLLWLFRRLILIRSLYEHDLKLERMARENTEQLNKSKLQFFTNISHEFRTPLTLILAPLEQLISSGEGSIHIRHSLKAISQNANRLQRLINQLLDFRKAEGGSLSLRVAEGNIYKFIKEIHLSFKALAEQKNIDFVFSASSNMINVYFDRDQMEKVIFNLISNAFNHTESGGTIEIQLIEHADYFKVIVANNGPAIPQEQADKIFERFYSASGSGDHMGTGIGLALCKSLVHLHHGKIEVYRKDSFTCFDVVIPGRKNDYNKDQILDNFKDSEYVGHYNDLLKPNESGAIPDASSDYRVDFSTLKKLLIVEDNHEVRALLKSIFQHEYQLLEAENGEQGLTLANEENPDLIISDVMMPKMDGFSLCTAIKQNLNTSHIPVVLLTARTSYIYQVEGLEKGADDYITKPFHTEVLKLKVINLLKSREQSRQLVQGSNELVLEPKKVTITSADEKFVETSLELMEANMSNSEYTVVEFGRDLGISRMQLYRKLKAITGLSPNEYIRMLRIKRAAQLLDQKALNISEVAYQVGFTDPDYFRKCFKRQFGVTPSAYLKGERVAAQS